MAGLRPGLLPCSSILGGGPPLAAVVSARGFVALLVKKQSGGCGVFIELQLALSRARLGGCGVHGMIKADVSSHLLPRILTPAIKRDGAAPAHQADEPPVAAHPTRSSPPRVQPRFRQHRRLLG